MINIKNLSCGYGKREIIKNVNMQIPEGGLCAVVGPNGSGKTTLLRAITKMLKFSSGEVNIKGTNINSMNHKQMAKIVSVVGQDVAVDNICVNDFVLMGRIPFFGKWQFFETSEDNRIAEWAMQVTGTTDFKNRMLSELSSGEKQLVLLAKALAQKPLILILDEPTAHLDIAWQIKIMGFLKQLNEKDSISVLLVIHDINLASKYCDYIYVFKDGFLKKGGRVSEVINEQIIDEVYGVKSVVKKDPVTLKPYVFI